MNTKIKFYNNRIAINFLAKDADNGKEVYDSIDGYTAVGILSNQFSTIEEGITYVTEFQKKVPVVSVGLGDGDPKQFRKAALIAAATDPGHVNQVFTGAGYAAGALEASNKKETAINVLISPTGIPGKVKISTGELSSKEKDAVIDIDTAMAMVLDMKAHSVKFYPMKGLNALKELEVVAEACVRHNVPMIEPTGGITLENLKEIIQVCLKGNLKIMPHIYGSVIDEETGKTKIEDVKKAYSIIRDVC